MRGALPSLAAPTSWCRPAKVRSVKFRSIQLMSSAVTRRTSAAVHRDDVAGFSSHDLRTASSAIQSRDASSSRRSGSMSCGGKRAIARSDSSCLQRAVVLAIHAPSGSGAKNVVTPPTLGSSPRPVDRVSPRAPALHPNRRAHDPFVGCLCQPARKAPRNAPRYHGRGQTGRSRCIQPHLVPFTPG